MRAARKVSAWVFAFACLLIRSGEALAAPATQLVLSNDFCLIEICGPHAPPARVATSGVSFEIFVAARDQSGARDLNYAGTIVFSSTDPLATLPASYTFRPEDEGNRAFVAILRTPGDQTITVADSGGKLVPGLLVMTVMGIAPTEPIPTISEWAKILLLVALALSGTWLSRHLT